MRVGILTGGGDAPGLNGIIESASKALLKAGHEVIGICDGFEGIFNQCFHILNEKKVSGIHAHAGTILGTSNRCSTAGREQEFLDKFAQLQLDCLVAAGGDGTFAGLNAFRDKIPLIGVPKTIDNDLAGTDITFGYDTACSTVSHAIDSLRTTADAHRRTIFIETMGRTAGWIALGGGLAGYADAILIPERPYSESELLKFIINKKRQGQRGVICVVGEGAHAEGGQVHVERMIEGRPQPEKLGGIAAYLAQMVDEQHEDEARHIVLGHLQRSAPPSTTDRFLTMAMGVQVAKLVNQQQWGSAVTYLQGKVQTCSIQDFMQPPRLIEKNHRWVEMAQAVGIFI